MEINSTKAKCLKGKFVLNCFTGACTRELTDLLFSSDLLNLCTVTCYQHAGVAGVHTSNTEALCTTNDLHATHPTKKEADGDAATLWLLSDGSPETQTERRNKEAALAHHRLLGDKPDAPLFQQGLRNALGSLSLYIWTYGEIPLPVQNV